MLDQPSRDLLFLSYAIEDVAFVKWLALKLSACGYRVWWDKERLLGGGAFPTEIDDAIKTKSFRLLAVLSKHSAHKPNPERERTIALNLARSRNENFLIPLNLGLSATELPWMVSNLTYISFDEWAAGLRQLLAELRAQHAPCWPDDAARMVTQNLVSRSFVVDEADPVWLNFFEIRDAPKGIHLYEWSQDVPSDQLGDWIYEVNDRCSCWAFEPPPLVASVRRPACDQTAISYDNDHRRGMQVRNAATSLLRKHIERQCLLRGLVEIPEGRVFYFPSSLPTASRFSFTLPDGRATWLRLVGTRRVWQNGRPEEIRYHLAASYRVELTRYGHPVLQVLPTAHFVGQDGGPLDRSRNVRRAKNLRRAWYNNKWLARVCGIGAFLAEGASDWALSPSLRARISAAPIRLTSPCRLDEEALFGSRSEDTDDLDDVEIDAIDDGDESEHE